MRSNDMDDAHAYLAVLAPSAVTALEPQQAAKHVRRQEALIAVDARRRRSRERKVRPGRVAHDEAANARLDKPVAHKLDNAQTVYRIRHVILNLKN